MCGVFGVWGAAEASKLAYLGLHALQHRGQESAGIATMSDDRLYVHRALGLVGDIFTQDVLAKLPGSHAVGHVRYSTSGGSHLRNAQPLAVDYALGSIAVAHNGNITNAEELRARLENDGSIFQSTSDTEVIVHLIARSRQKRAVDRVVEALGQLQGAFSVTVLTGDELIAARDAHGFRPLCLGSMAEGSMGPSWVVASEPPAFELIGATYSRDLDPGEVVVISSRGIDSFRPFAPTEQRRCIFEHVYFARPDAKLEQVSVYDTRKAFGRTLAQECPVDADVVIPVPDSGVAAALGFAEQMRLPFEMGLIRSHYVGRTFIEPTQAIRHFGVRLKLSPVKHILDGRRVAVVDDSIVRGTTSRKIVQMIRAAGAKEVHLRISSPPTQWPCYYGIDTPSRSELIAATHSVDETRTYVTADSLGYLSLQGLHRSIGGAGFCDACFSGAYPVPFPREHGPARRQLPLVGV